GGRRSHWPHYAKGGGGTVKRYRCCRPGHGIQCCFFAALGMKERLPDLLHEPPTQTNTVRQFSALANGPQLLLSSRGPCFLGRACQRAETNYNHCAEIFHRVAGRVSLYEIWAEPGDHKEI